jgi:hypothetical protein
MRTLGHPTTYSRQFLPIRLLSFVVVSQTFDK